MTAKKDRLRELGIFNDANLCQRTGMIITTLRSMGSNGAMFVSGVCYGEANGRTWDVKYKLPCYGRSMKLEMLQKMKEYVGGEWERTPFSPDSFVPKGSVEKILSGN